MRITSTNSVENSKVKMIIYGLSGVGKTSTVKTINGKVLIISSEAGLLCLKDHQPAIDVIDISVDDNGKAIPKEKRMERLGEVYKYVLTDDAMKKYDWLFIDSLTEISQNLLEYLQTEFPERKDSLVLYGENAKKMRSFIKLFRDIPHYNVVFTALSEIEKDDLNRRFTSIKMVGKISQDVPSLFDEVFHMSIVENPETKETKRIFLTGGVSDIACKDRSGKLAKFEEVNITNIYNKIMGVKK